MLRRRAGLRPQCPATSRQRRTGRVRASIAVLVPAVAALGSAAPAQASTVVTGALDSNAPLEIVPSADPFTAALDTWSSSKQVAYIQEMPVSKTITSVTLGDFASDPSCTTEAVHKLHIRHYPLDRHPSSTGNHLASSATTQTIPMSLSRVTWTFSTPVTLKKGMSYAFELSGVVTGGACSKLQQRTWAHNSPTVNGGEHACARPPQMGAGGGEGYYLSPHRMWHVHGVDDRDSACAIVGGSADVPYFNPDMPGGWIRTNVYCWGGCPQVDIETSYPASSSPSFRIPDCEMVDGYAAGFDLRKWRDLPVAVYGQPATQWICAWTQFSAKGERVPDGWYWGSPWRWEKDAAPRDIYLRLDTIDYDGLLERYTPQLRYHFAESYRADSAWTATLPLPPWSGDSERSNNLERENGTILAAADPLLGHTPLSLDALPARGAAAELYGAGEPALDSDRIDFRNDSYQDDAAAMHANSGLANRIYARATQDANGKVWLQYWFFYYYNEGILSFFDHEADWEMIQIGLTSGLVPDVATYAQHSGAQSCPWDRVPKYTGPEGDAPVAFVELGSHASLFYASAPASYVVASGAEHVRPAVERQLGNASPSWASWRGRWGGSTDIIRSPGEQGLKWDGPATFNAEADGCPAEAVGGVVSRRQATPPAPGAETPPAPVVRAERTATGVRVQYRYTREQWKRLSRTAELVLAVRSDAPASLPRSVVFRPPARAGTRRVTLAREAPTRVQAQTITRSGAQSEPVTVPVR
jgi:hypothetical protein